MGSSVSGGDEFGGEPLGDEDFGDGGEDFGGEPASSDKPFDDTPFDAGVEADEEDNPEKYIQQLSGKLGQSLRKYTEELGAPDYDLEKFAINSVLSATNSGEMDQQDQADIIQKVKSSTTDGTGKKNDEPEEADIESGDGADDFDGEDEFSGEGSLDLSGIDMEESVLEKKSTDDLLNKKVYVANRKQSGIVKKINGEDIVVELPKSKEMIKVTLADVKEITEQEFNPNANGKTVFEDPYMGVEDGGMEENKYLNLEKSEKSSNFVVKETIKKMVRETFATEPAVKPQVKPQVTPQVKPSRRSKPYRIIPEQLPDPRPKAEKKNEPQFIKASDFSDDKNSVSISFDVDGERFVGNFINSGDVITKPKSYKEPWVYAYQSDIMPNGKQYYVGVGFEGHPREHLEFVGFEDGDMPTIYEV